MVDVLVVEDEGEALLRLLLAIVVSEVFAVLVEMVGVIDDVILTIVVTAVVDAVLVAAGELVVTMADFEVVIRADVIPSDVVALADDCVVTPVLSPPPDGRSVTQITPTNRPMKRTAAIGTKVVLPHFNYCSASGNNSSPNQTLHSLKHRDTCSINLSSYPRQTAL